MRDCEVCEPPLIKWNARFRDCFGDMYNTIKDTDKQNSERNLAMATRLFVKNPSLPFPRLGRRKLGSRALINRVHPFDFVSLLIHSGSKHWQTDEQFVWSPTRLKDFYHPVHLSLLQMAQIDRPQNRAYSPYTIDSLEAGSTSLSTFTGCYMNPAYENSGLVQIQRDSTTNTSTLKRSYQNPTYENSELDHQYEDPSHLVPCTSAWSSRNTGPKRKDNTLYESTELKRTARESTSNGGYNNDVARESWISRLILLLILMVSLASLLLVILIIFGKLGPVCCKELQGKVLSNCFAKRSA